MINEIKSHDRLYDEYSVFDMLCNLKIEHDKARFELWSYQLNDLINSYHELKQLRKDIQAKYFDMLEKIDESEFASVDVSYENWSEVRSYENANWEEEVELMSRFKYHLDDILMQLNDGTIEQMMIDEERNIA